ncbi:UDP-N-acetylglucosamine 2-epimerase (non-hydrolyzing) [Marinobacter nanhaiticus D15-8W]|uniref:UDP-N-acetylglucosamine 2-epimerase (non-hydrolyzing) n=1 Tax=Marinobacter nanhaiticus D15-8W TaxID=626887 RepID=N6VYF1_9GAMM|nr:UDP-N-acetylglucosamine 2-epimerase (non-hydrolyzing) [Marinobacter nanhaiticus]ENO12904.1 UDP-N-acetylglucosamine 2-epimerase (non-hydrolyzing) [Marinobacter nanhaiticus D15-8W]BES70255.1 UDP-N-acetylglucosamine 2-epimerase (non-hydrolyzing) [Marinobacter nanhaiticus D15-8W]
MKKILVIAGTRPEVIKLAPVYLEAVDRFGTDAVEWINTGQHTALADLALQAFGVSPGRVLESMAPGGSLGVLTRNLVSELDGLFTQSPPEAVVVQGDTTTAFAGALVAFYHRIPSIHVEAGLRSFDCANPFPEEANRRMISSLATIHCAPTPRAAENLRREGVSEAQILITGNTVVDAVHHVRDKLLHLCRPVDEHKRRILVTMHRREAWGDEMEKMCIALRTLADSRSQVEIHFPVHLNPRVREPVHRLLGHHPRIHLLDPLDYLSLQKVLSQSYLVLTDSGGIQEEAPSYGVPVLVLRRLTERPEAVEQGSAQVTGTDPDIVVSAAQRLIDDHAAYRSMVKNVNPFGDGYAAARIVQRMAEFLSQQPAKTERASHVAA